MSTSEPQWILWVRELQALAQTGLAFTRDPYDIERYTKLRALAAQMLATATGTDPLEMQSLMERQAGYATPKVDVRAASFRDGRVLLVQERSDGCWTLPGGWADVIASRCLANQPRR